MKIKYILFLGSIAFFSSCSTAYRTSQTPDDVYYSSAPVQGSNLITSNDDDQNSYYTGNDQNSPDGSQDQSYSAPVTYDLGFDYNPYDYNALGFNSYLYNGLSFGNLGYGYDPYGYMGMYNPYLFNSFGYGGLGLFYPYSFYNPYGFYNPYSIYNPTYYGNGHSSSIYFTAPGSINTNTGPRRYNLNAYTNISTTPANTTSSNVSAPIRRTTGFGNIIRRVFVPNRVTYVNSSNSNGRSYNNSNNNDRYYNNSNNTRTFNNNNNSYQNNPQTPSRSYNNSPSVSTPSYSGGSSSSAPVRSFGR
ncbi:MAG TPA: hypothetical protein VIJ95_11785 [Hanamia sp.]